MKSRAARRRYLLVTAADGPRDPPPFRPAQRRSTGAEEATS
jgi:hypothetical protein